MAPPAGELKALSPSIVRAAKVCQEKGLTKYRWSCRSFPELNPRFDNHLLAQTSRPAPERWLQPENMVGSKAWYKTTGKNQQGRKWLEQYGEFAGHLSDSWNLHPTLPCRDAWITGSDMGGIHGTPSQQDPPLLGHQPKGYSRWVQGNGERWTPDMPKVPRIVPAREFNRKAQAGLIAISQGKDPKAARKTIDAKMSATLRKSKRSASPAQSYKSMNSSGALSGTQSMPTLALGPYPPSPAYVRAFMRQIDLEKPDM